MSEKLFDKFCGIWNEAKSNPLVNAGRGAQQVDSAIAFRARESNREKILARLQMSEWVSTPELIEITHRFSASIHELRERGHTITGRPRDDGTYEWKHESYSPMEFVSDGEKASYYLSTHWKMKRLERLEFDGYQCCWCKATDSLHVHHWLYALFCEHVNDLMTLCEDCHNRIHALTDIHFPKTVCVNVKRQLELLQ